MSNALHDFLHKIYDLIDPNVKLVTRGEDPAMTSRIQLLSCLWGHPRLNKYISNKLLKKSTTSFQSHSMIWRCYIYLTSSSQWTPGLGSEAKTHLLQVLFTRRIVKSFADHGFSIWGSRAWNKLPESLQLCSNTDYEWFRWRQKHLFQRDWP